MTESDADDGETFTSRRERDIVLVGGGVLALGVAGFVAFTGGRGTGSAGEFVGRPEITGAGLAVSVLLILVGAALVHWAERLS